jgi:hypothetical protein
MALQVEIRPVGHWRRRHGNRHAAAGERQRAGSDSELPHPHVARASVSPVAGAAITARSLSAQAASSFIAGATVKWTVGSQIVLG